MVHLAGQFAGLAHVTLPDGQVAALKQALQTLQQGGLQILVQQAEVGASRSVTPLTLELLGQDRPASSTTLPANWPPSSVNIEELEGEQRPAPMSGELLFYAYLKLGLPAGGYRRAVQDTFEKHA